MVSKSSLNPCIIYWTLFSAHCICYIHIGTTSSACGSDKNNHLWTLYLKNKRHIIGVGFLYIMATIHMNLPPFNDMCFIIPVFSWSLCIHIGIDSCSTCCRHLCVQTPPLNRIYNFLNREISAQMC